MCVPADTNVVNWPIMLYRIGQYIQYIAGAESMTENAIVKAVGEARRTYDVEEAGRLLGIGRNAAYDAAKRGEIPTIKMGRRLLVPKAAFDRLLENGR